jgi:hypothetical protein
MLAILFKRFNAFEYKAEVGKADCQQRFVGQDGGNDEIF